MTDDWRPQSDREAWRFKARLLREIREFFHVRGVLEVETPALSRAANTDPHIESFEVEDQDRRWFLRTSAEFPMKRMLAAGSGPIYELGRVFRRGEAGRWHNPEFTMLEWYRPGHTCTALIDEVFDLIESLAGLANDEIRGRRRISFAAAFSEIADGLDPLVATDGELRAFLERQGWFRGNLCRADAIDLTLALGLPAINGPGNLLAVYDYPVELAALARIKPDDPRIAERFEVFLGGVELANGYRELTDADELERRFGAENARRAAARQKVVPPDHLMLAAHRAGLPDCSGVALGVDRLIAALIGADDLAQVLAFTAERA